MKYIEAKGTTSRQDLGSYWSGAKLFCQHLEDRENIRSRTANQMLTRARHRWNVALRGKKNIYFFTRKKGCNNNNDKVPGIPDY